MREEAIVHCSRSEEYNSISVPIILVVLVRHVTNPLLVVVNAAPYLRHQEEGGERERERERGGGW